MSKKPTVRSSAAKKLGYPRREPSGWLIAPGTSFIPDEWWPFFDGSANEAPWDDPAWAIQAVSFLRGELGLLASLWLALRAPEQIQFMGRFEVAIGLAMNRVLHFAPVLLTSDECDRIETAYAVLKAGLAEYARTSTDIRLAGGDAAPRDMDIRLQAHALRTQGDNKQLATLLLAVAEANPFRNPAIRRLIGEGGVLDRLQSKLWQIYKAAHEGTARRIRKKRRQQPKKIADKHKPSVKLGLARETADTTTSPEADWSRPMSLTDMAIRLFRDASMWRKVRSAYGQHMRQLNRKTWQIRLDKLGPSERRAMEQR